MRFRLSAPPLRSRCNFNQLQQRDPWLLLRLLLKMMAWVTTIPETQCAVDEGRELSASSD
jgi:hypothetical protein